MRNIARHSGATEATIALARHDGGVQLIVSDNGKGFDPEAQRDKSHLGLASMRQRIAMLGGRLSIDSSPGRGTAIRAWVPTVEE